MTDRRWIDRFWAIFASALIALMCGVTYAVWEDHILNRQNSYKIEAISEDVTEMKHDLRQAAKVWYPRKEAVQQFTRVRGELNDHEQRIRELERMRAFAFPTRPDD